MIQKIPALNNIGRPISLRERAFQTIKEAIKKGQFKPGYLYREHDLAKVLGISRTPVHEALIELASKGFVKVLPRKGFQINKLNESEVQKLYTFRKALEIAVIREISVIATAELISELQAIIEIQNHADSDNDLYSFIEADREFHFILADLTQNHYIISALKNVRDLIDWYGTRVLLKQKASSQQAIQEHIAITEMLEKRNISGALSKMEEHLNMSEQRILKLVKR